MNVRINTFFYISNLLVVILFLWQLLYNILMLTDLWMMKCSNHLTWVKLRKMHGWYQSSYSLGSFVVLAAAGHEIWGCTCMSINITQRLSVLKLSFFPFPLHLKTGQTVYLQLIPFVCFAFIDFFCKCAMLLSSCLEKLFVCVNMLYPSLNVENLLNCWIGIQSYIGHGEDTSYIGQFRNSYT